MISHLFAVAAVIVEFFAVKWLAASVPPVQAITRYLVLHAAACMLGSVALWHVLPPRYRHPRTWVMSGIATFGFFTPILGLVVIVLGCLIFLRFKRKQLDHEIMQIATPPFMAEAQVHLSQFGEGGGRARLINSGAPKHLRVKALLAMEGLSGRSSNEVIRLAMQDEDDEVRLLAFGILDQRENQLNARIHDVMQKLRDTGLSPTERGEFHRQAAQLYWELVYQELVLDTIMDHAVEQALVHAGEAASLLPDDAGIYLLLGRIRMHMKEYPAAREAFQRAQERGIQENRVVPYLAELAYLDRDYATVKGLFAANSSYASVPVLAQIVSFWGRHE